jgi:hypothetical protein
VDLERAAPLLVFALISLVIGLGLWYLSVRFRVKVLKPFAVMTVAMPVIAIAIQFFAGRAMAEFRTSAVFGPSRHEAVTANDTPFSVTNAQAEHRIELTPKVWGGTQPAQAVLIRYTVQSPKSEILAQGEHEFDPAPKLRWAPWSIQFQPREEGEHKLVLEVPNAVGSVDIRIQELR